MAMNRRFEQIFIFFLALLFAGVIINSLSFPPRARSIPLVIGIPGLILCLWDLIATNIRLKKERILSSKNLQPDSQREDFRFSKFFINIFVLPLSLFLMAYFLGFIVSVPLFIFCYMKFHSGEKWLNSFGTALLMLLATYIGFSKLLKVPLYEGVLIVSLNRLLFGW